MSDTTFFGKTVSASFKACCLYVLADLGVDLVKSMATMDRATWDAMWWMPKVAFWLSPIASAAVMIKAFYSNSK
jgi:hypothetical protein